MNVPNIIAAAIALFFIVRIVVFIIRTRKVTQLIRSGDVTIWIKWKDGGETTKRINELTPEEVQSLSHFLHS